MEIKEINELTRNWTVDEFADFLHYLLQHGDRESIHSWWCSTSLLRKLEAAGLAELDGGEVALTPSGSKLRDALYLLEDSPDIADANLNLRDTACWTGTTTPLTRRRCCAWRRAGRARCASKRRARSWTRRTAGTGA